MAAELTDERPVFLSTLPAGPRERRLALAVVLASVVVFLAAAPLAKVPLAQVWAFIPIYESALVINDLITAVLLLGQFEILRSRALLVLASGYLFTAFIAVAHALTFPGLFSSTGLLGAGSQSTAWLYMFWHGGFPLLIVVYALLKDTGREPGPPRARARVAVLSSVAAVLVAVAAFTLLATAGQDSLPAIMRGNRYTPAMITVVSSVWGLSLLALVVLWRRRPHSVLDLWLMVVMCAWLCDVALAAVLNAGRFDLGFYTGRIYGLLAASFVLLGIAARERHALRPARRGARERAPESHRSEGREPGAGGVLLFGLARPSCAAARGGRLCEDAGGRSRRAARRGGMPALGVVRASGQRMGQLIDDLLAFSRVGRQTLRTQPVQLDDLVSQTIDELRSDYDGRRIDFAVGRLGIVEADPALLRQVLANLLGNAIKFTRDKNAAVVEVGCREEPEGDGKIYYVKDNGAGFDMRYADKLFGVFQRLHRVEEYEGTGVGLAIVQRVIDRHGGRVWADSKPGEGAAFYFTLQSRSRDLSTSGHSAG